MTDSSRIAEGGSSRHWVTRTVIGIIAATFLSDVSHEMATAVLPAYLAAIGLGPAALGLIEGSADLLGSLSRLGGGLVGHRVHRKRPWAALGYLGTSVAVGAMGFVHSLTALVSLRGIAWMARGFRGPLRDFLLSDAVEPTHVGRAFGLERAGDMLGAVTGSLIAMGLIWAGLSFHTVILWTLVPGMGAAAAMFFLTRERPTPTAQPTQAAARPPFPRKFWMFLIGVFLFGMGDFSRTLLIYLAGSPEHGATSFSIAALLYAMHNLVSAAAAYPIGHAGDRGSKLRVLLMGYGLGAATNLLLAFGSGSLPIVIAGIVLSGIYLAAEETLEKATAAQMLPRELRSLGFGILASANAVGDMASSIYVGWLLEHGHAALAFGIAAGFGAMGVVWLLRFTLRPIPTASHAPH